MRSFSFWVFSVLYFTYKKQLHFFRFRTQLAHFRGFWGNNSSKQCQIELKFWLKVGLIVAPVPFKAFCKTRIFTETGCTQMFLVQLWPQFTHWRWPKSKTAIGLSKSKSRPYLFSIFNENYNYFLLYWGFFRVQMGPG